MQRYYKIGELSKLYGIGTDSIRYYEELGLIAPKRSEAGYRLYSINDIWRMNVIRDLRELGFSMERIHTYLDRHSVATTLRLLQDEIAVIQEKEAQLRRLRANAASRLEALRDATKQPCDVVEMVSFPQRRCFRTEKQFNTDEEMDVLLKSLLNHIQTPAYIIGNPQIGSRIHAPSLRDEKAPRYDAVFIVHEDGDQTIAAGDYLMVRYRGSSKKTWRYVPTLISYAEKHGLAVADEFFEMILVDIHVSSNYQEHITEIQARLL